MQKKPPAINYGRFVKLSDKDSNLERQNQNLQCYHYTIGQKNSVFQRSAKVKVFKEISGKII